MTPYLFSLLCDPKDHSPLTIKYPRLDEKGNIMSGILVSKNGNTYPVRRGIPRFTGERAKVRSVLSLVEQHSDVHHNFYKDAWLNEYVIQTFGSPLIFQDKTVIDCGGGTGYQGKWMVEHGAKHVIILENSQRIDGIARECMENCNHIDIVQCSLEFLPFKAQSFSGLITCNDVLQHTPSFENSLKSLWRLLTDKGEVVISCPIRQSKYWYHTARYRFVNVALRQFLSKGSVHVTAQYARLVSLLHLVPFVGYVLIKNQFVFRTSKPSGHFCMRQRYKDAFNHTFEYFAGHKHQHVKTAEEFKKIVHFLQKNPLYILNSEAFFQKDRPVGLALRIKQDM